MLPLLLVIVLGILAAILWSRRDAKWTVMIYMNARNLPNEASLETAALCNFHEMAQIGSGDGLNIVVQFARPGNVKGRITCKDSRPEVPQWSGVARFLIRHRMSPELNSAVATLGDVNMAEATTLEDFVTWAMETYRAKHFLLILWNHGDGNTVGLQLNAKASSPGFTPRAFFKEHQINDDPLSFVLQDNVNGFHKLHIREVEDGLSQVLRGRKLDIVGFDACLMGMVENAYAMRNLAQVMIASEETEPDFGWNYNYWLAKLKANLRMEAGELASTIVQTYNDQYRDGGLSPFSTQSAVKLDGMEALASVLDDLISNCKQPGADCEALKTIALEARPHCEDDLQCFEYGGGIGGMDLGLILNNLMEMELTTGIPPALAKARAKLFAALQAVVLDDYANETRGFFWGSLGLSIHFPGSKEEYDEKYKESGYDENPKYRSDFDIKHDWGKFLAKLFESIQ